MALDAPGGSVIDDTTLAGFYMSFFNIGRYMIHVGVGEGSGLGWGDPRRALRTHPKVIWPSPFTGALTTRLERTSRSPRASGGRSMHQDACPPSHFSPLSARHRAKWPSSPSKLSQQICVPGQDCLLQSRQSGESDRASVALPSAIAWEQSSPTELSPRNSQTHNCHIYPLITKSGRLTLPKRVSLPLA